MSVFLYNSGGSSRGSRGVFDNSAFEIGGEEVGGSSKYYSEMAGGGVAV